MLEAFGGRHYLQQAIGASQELTASPEIDSDNQAKAICNGAWAFSMRFEHYNIDSDLERAIVSMEEAMRLDTDPSIKADCGSRLMIFLTALAEHFTSDATLNDALTQGQEIYRVLQISAKGMCAHQLSGFSRLKYERARRFQGPKDLQATLDYATDAVRLSINKDHRAMHLDNLARCSEVAHRRYPLKNFLQMAIDKSRGAVAVIASVRRGAASYSNLLAYLLKLRNEEGGSLRGYSHKQSSHGNRDCIFNHSHHCL